MKTTVEIPDPLFRRAKSFAAGRGLSLRRFITEALEEKLQEARRRGEKGSPPWMRLAGSLRHHRTDLRRAERAIEEECERIDPDDWK